MAKEIQFLLYNLPHNSGTVQVYVENETLWLTQKAMSKLFDVSVPAINQHLKNIYETNELTPEATIKKNLIVQQEDFLIAEISRRHKLRQKQKLNTTFSIRHNKLTPILTKKSEVC